MDVGDCQLCLNLFFIFQNGFVQGVMHLLLLSMSAHLTRELGMAPGGEFRVAVREVRKVFACDTWFTRKWQVAFIGG